MKNLRDDVLETVKQFQMPPGVRRIVLAVSGGADSMALAHAMLNAFPQYRYVIAHLNHGLRVEATAEAAMVREFAEAQHAEFALKNCDIAALARERGQGIEETGREERYRFFRSLGGDLIFTAHHRDDNAETVLLHFIRGCGLKGLCGMAPLEGDIARPLLTLPKSALVAYCEAQGIPYAVDSSNADTRYTRNKVRQEVIPLLEEINPRVSEALNRLAAAAFDDNALLEQLTVEFIQAYCRSAEAGFAIDRKALKAQPPAIGRRVLLRLCEELDIFLSAENCAALLQLKNGKEMPLNRAYSAYADDVTLFLCPKRDKETDPVTVAIPYENALYEIGDYRIAAAVVPESRKGNAAACGDLSRRYWEQGNPVFRHRRPGDWVRLPSGHRKKLSDVLIDAKIPGYLREELLLLAVDGEVLWLLGYRIFGSGDGECLRLSYTKKS